ncbi:hypothetical protein FB45DRAFT_1053224 [Roridomyces roridus]|uniref:DUF6699 domain-containing protein n=1 Tax=Roridomyces roridus TaxID=1738132 RepID=A0AAD7CBP7_9AGAR|nr:hypothetical protein FB45DRAFT_1053224 [Roridomyces roridus]
MPPQTQITIRIAAVGSSRGLCVLGISSRNRQGEADFITVGDVLTTIHDTLRQQLSLQEADSAARGADVQRYRVHRVSTVDTYLEASHLDPGTCRDVKRAEVITGVRRVDLLRGAVMFDGIVVKSKSPGKPEMWLVGLTPAERYADGSG